MKGEKRERATKDSDEVMLHCLLTLSPSHPPHPFSSTSTHPNWTVFPGFRSIT